MTTLRSYKDRLLRYIHDEVGIPMKDLEDVFAKWIFNANIAGTLGSDLVPTTNIIDDADIKFLTSKFHGRYKKLSFTIEYKLTSRQMKRLHDIYIGKDFNADVQHLCDTYDTLGGLHNLASFPLGLFDDYDIIELFGSPLNTQYRYCSAFEFESVFGSMGSFFKYDLKDGIHVANPPFDESLMLMMSNRLVDQLKNGEKAIVVILPAWDPETQRATGIKNYNKPFAALQVLQTSPYFRYDLILNKNYAFYDYHTDTYKKLTHSHLILLDNYDSKFDLVAIRNKWLKIVS